MRLDMVLHGSPPQQVSLNNTHFASAEDRVVLPKESEMEDVEVDKERLKTAVQDMNNLLDQKRTNLKYVYHDKLERYYVEVLDQSSDEVIREIPPKKMLDMYASIAERMGLITDEKV